MAKDKYILSTTVSIEGKLDFDEDEKIKVYVEQKDLPTYEIDVVELLKSEVGKCIALKLTDERDLIDE